jgi:precorrin-3B methylase
VVGNSTTYLQGGRIVTPRGYEEKTASRSPASRPD